MSLIHTDMIKSANSLDVVKLHFELLIVMLKQQL